MRAAVLNHLGHVPVYEENFADPVIAKDNEIIMHVKAAAIKNLDKGRASGSYYASHTNLPEVVGVDGVGVLEDGTRAYAFGLSGMIAEKALIDKYNYTRLPDHIDFASAAALPNAVLGAALALKYRAHIKAGSVVLINGATGVTGHVALQIAKYYGAGKVYVTGRNQFALNRLKELGADEVISLEKPRDEFIKSVYELHKSHPIDIVIDYIWGTPAEMILHALKGSGLHSFSNNVRFVTVGDMAGKSIQLDSGILRSSAIEVLGSGIGSLPKEAFEELRRQILPEMMDLVVKGKILIDVVTRPLQEVASAWNEKIPAGQRMVIMI